MRKKRSERAHKTCGKMLRIRNQTLFVEFTDESGASHKVAIDCPPDLDATRVMITCTPGVKWYYGSDALDQ
jgi:hypothetical protein